MLVHGTSQIEVALDRGELRARVEGRSDASRWPKWNSS